MHPLAAPPLPQKVGVASESAPLRTRSLPRVATTAPGIPLDRMRRLEKITKGARSGWEVCKISGFKGYINSAMMIPRQD
jgi:hypothetical protein